MNTTPGAPPLDSATSGPGLAPLLAALLAPLLALAACSAPVTKLAPVPPAPSDPAVSDPARGEPAGATRAAPAEPLSAELLDLLVENGALTDDQAAGLRARSASAPAAPEQGSQDATPGAVVTLDRRGLNIRSADGQTSMKIGGRVQADATFHSRDSEAGVPITDGTELRRGRFELRGRMPHGFFWAAELDFANDASSVKDFWMGVRDEDGNKFMLGHQKQPFSLGVEMSSNDIPFTERGIDNYLIIPFIDRAIGARIDIPTEETYFAAGVFGESVSGNPSDDEGWGATARYVWAPVQEDDETVHLGVRGAWRRPMQSSGSISFADETTNMSNFAVVGTGTIGGVDQTVLYGAEAAWAKGPFSLTGEYNRVDVGRAGQDLDFMSWHVETTWSLTGESRAAAYNIGSGEFKRLRPASTTSNPFSGGAWEVAARWASIDLQDAFVAGGEEDAFTLGLNWYATNNVRFLFDWTRIADTSGGSAVTQAADGLDVFTFRAQLTF